MTNYEQAMRRIDSARDEALARLDAIAQRVRGEGKSVSGRTRYGLETKTLSIEAAWIASRGYPNLIETKCTDGKQHITFEAYGSTFSEDLDGDTIQPGAFNESIRLLGGSCPLLKGHDRNVILGIAADLREDEKGLRFTGVLANTQAAQEMGELFKIGAVGSFSIGFYPPSAEHYKRVGRGRHIYRVKLMEISATPFPANQQARLM
jgi:HK97 family phage prohead protease